MKCTKRYSIMSVLMALTFASCGAGTSGDSSSSLSSIENLPRATAPVVDSSSGLAAALGFKNASTGIVLGDLGESTFDETSSVAACEVTNKFREAISSAAQGDEILCFVQNVVEVNPDLDFDIYDGTYHVIGLSIINDDEGGDGGPSKVKMKIHKDADGNIDDFEMFACDSSNEQKEYIHQTIGNGGSFSMTSKGFHQDDDGSGSHHVTVTGTLEDGRFTSKTIEIEHVWSGDEGDNFGASTVMQEPDAITYNGYDAGSYSNNGNSGTYSNRGYARAQLIDGNEGNSEEDPYNIGLLAVGDGAARAIMSGESTSGEWMGTWGDDVVQGWDGDTKVEDAAVAADYITVVQSVTPVEAGTEAPVIAFDTSETDTGDCDEEPVATVTVDVQVMQTACSSYRLGHDWINCWEVTGQNN